MDRRLARGRCPYPDKWKSGLNRRIFWPPIDVHIFEGNNVCHTTCTGSSCSSPGQPPGPPSDPDAPAPPEPIQPLMDGSASCEEDEGDPAIDWAGIAELSDIFAPFSVTGSANPSASGTPGASSSTAVMSDQSIFVAYDNMQQQAIKRVAAATASEIVSDSPLDAAPTPPAKRKPPAFVMGKRGRGLVQQANLQGPLVLFLQAWFHVVSTGS